VNGVEDRLSIMWTKGVRSGLLSENQFVEKTSTNAAQIFNMYPNKGVIREGADADIVIWDPNLKKIISAKAHHHAHDFNVFEGMEVYGRAENTFSRGELVWDGKSFHNQHQGKFVERKTHGFTYRRHSAWTKLNDPLNFKVDRSGSSPGSVANSLAPTNSASSQANNEVQRLQEEVSRLRQENAELSNQANTQKLS